MISLVEAWHKGGEAVSHRKAFDIAPDVVAQATSADTPATLQKVVLLCIDGNRVSVFGADAIRALRDACDFALGEPT